MKLSEKKFKLFVSLLCFLIMTGFARVEKVRVLEGDISEPYQKIGIIEVQQKASIFRPADLFYWTAEALTLGFAKTPDRSNKLKAELDKQLQTKARNHYGADAVIFVKYWPDTHSESFPSGVVRARGTMIQYVPFPNDEHVKTVAAEIASKEAAQADIKKSVSPSL